MKRQMISIAGNAVEFLKEIKKIETAKNHRTVSFASIIERLIIEEYNKVSQRG